MNSFIIYSDVDKVKEELTGLIPLDEVPDDPIYFTLIIPEVILRKFEEHKSKDEDQNNNMVTAVQEDNDSELENYCATGADNLESDSEGECKSRFEWKLSTTKKAAIYTQKEIEKTGIFFKKCMEKGGGVDEWRRKEEPLARSV